MSELFRTEVKQEQTDWDVDYSQSLIFMGSCFSDSIGSMLIERKFNAISNPFGVMYNPISVAASFDRILNCRLITQDDLVFHDQMWHCFDMHGSFSGPIPEEVCSKINQKIELSHQFLKTCSHLFVTFGTAWIFQNKTTGNVVANCHKLPDWSFLRRRLTVSEIVNVWTSLIDRIKVINPSVNIVFTVSPIRHFKDGAHENQLSKSTLMLAVDSIMAHGFQNFSYFPSYELVMDELRDYRFYASDMIHLSDVAIDFIFSKFTKSCMSDSTLMLMGKIQKLNQAVNHRFLRDNESERVLFAQKQLRIIAQLEDNAPFINFLSEKEYFRDLLKNRNSFSINLSDNSTITNAR